VATDNARVAFADIPGGVEMVPRSSDALEGADALVVVTEWKEFRSPDTDALKSKLKQPVVFDGRNLYDPQLMHLADIEYHGIGRRPVA
jgi:UDPglucose 6-dehydrogenase